MSLQSTNQKIKITLQENKQHRRLNKSILLSICFKHVCLPINRINFANFINKYQLQTIFLQTLGGIPPLGYKELDSVSAVFFFFLYCTHLNAMKVGIPQEKSLLCDNKYDRITSKHVQVSQTPEIYFSIPCCRYCIKS